MARRKGHLEKIAAAGAERTHVVAADLAATDVSWAWIDEAGPRSAPIDVLVNNAGVRS